mmetsp:Transcript_20827/g.25499  ORF Transcript_20827/g.25499 Transcript_20827/m.25499 type:complete len:133 (-) Transcript_20827:155-553(-)
MAAVKRNKISRTARERAISNASDDDYDGAPSGPGTAPDSADGSFVEPTPPSVGRNAARSDAKMMKFGTGSVPKRPTGLSIDIDDSNDVDEHGQLQESQKASGMRRIGETTTPRQTNLPSARSGRNPLAQSAH